MEVVGGNTVGKFYESSMLVAQAAMAASPSVLVVGGGLTGAAAGRALTRLLPEGRVVVWEALDCLGGRFHTEVTRDGGACDTGAQYITVTDDEAVARMNAPVLNELSSAGVLTAMHGRIMGGRAADGKGANYIAPAGLSSVVAHMFASSKLHPVCARRAVRLRAAVSSPCEPPRRRPQQWEVHAADGHKESFDAVVLTQPLPEMRSCKGNAPA